MLELDDAPDLPVELDVHAVLELVGRDRFGQSGASLVEGHQFLCEPAQHLGAVFGHDDEVLDPHSAEAGEVDPRLDGDDVAGDELPRRGRERGDSCTSRPTPWPSPWSTRGPPPRSPCGRSRRARGSRHRRGPRRAPLPGRSRRPIRLAQRFGELAGRERARAVGAVAVHLRAEVDDHGLAGPSSRSPGW